MSGYQAFLYRMPSGIPGSVSRNSAFTIEPNIISVTTPPAVYGVPLKLDANGHMTGIVGGDTAASVYGFLARPFPTNSGTQGIAQATPPVSGPCDILKMGYINVKVNNGTPVKGGTVYIRTAANGTNTIIGGVEAASDTTYSFSLPNAYFTGGMDANGNSEIAYNV